MVQLQLVPQPVLAHHVQDDCRHATVPVRTDRHPQPLSLRHRIQLGSVRRAGRDQTDETRCVLQPDVRVHIPSRIGRVDVDSGHLRRRYGRPTVRTRLLDGEDIHHRLASALIQPRPGSRDRCDVDGKRSNGGDALDTLRRKDTHHLLRLFGADPSADPVPGSTTHRTRNDGDTRHKAVHHMAVLMQHVHEQLALHRTASLHA